MVTIRFARQRWLTKLTYFEAGCILVGAVLLLGIVLLNPADGSAEYPVVAQMMHCIVNGYL